MCSKKNILIVQFRSERGGKDRADAASHERMCFDNILSTSFSSDALASLFMDGTQRSLDRSMLAGVDAVILGGSHTRLHPDRISDDWPWGLEAVEGFVREILDRDIPVLGICFGFQLLGKIYGATIGEFAEAGSSFVKADDSAASDPLFSRLHLFANGRDGSFVVQQGHNDGIIGETAPSGMSYLALTRPVPGKRRYCEAFRLEGKQAWGVLFHPDLDRQSAADRYFYFCGETIGRKEAEERFTLESPEASRIIPCFLEVAGFSSPGQAEA